MASWGRLYFMKMLRFTALKSKLTAWQKKQQHGFGLYGQFPPTLQQVIFLLRV